MKCRYNLYEKRKEYQLNELEKELLILSNKARYITEILNDIIDLRRKSKDEIIKMLEKHKYAKIDDEDINI